MVLKSCLSPSLVPVADPEGTPGGHGPQPQFCTFRIWKYVPNKTRPLAPLAPDIGP